MLIVVGITYSLCGQRDTVNNYESLPTALGPYLLRRRILSWVKQAFGALNVVVSTVLIFYIPNEMVMDRVARCIFLLSIVCVLRIDGIDNLAHMKRKLAWIVSYLIAAIYAAIAYVAFPEWLTFVSFFCTIVSFMFAILCAVFDIKAMQINPPTAEYSCGLFEYLTFSYLNPILIQLARQKKVLDFEDIPSVVDADSSEQIWDRFRLILSFYKDQISLEYSLFKLVQYEWLTSGVFQFIGSISMYLAPLALERILLHISNNGRDDDEAKSLFPITVRMAVVILFAGPMLKSVGDGQNYAKGR